MDDDERVSIRTHTYHNGRIDLLSLIIGFDDLARVHGTAFLEGLIRSVVWFTTNATFAL